MLIFNSINLSRKKTLIIYSHSYGSNKAEGCDTLHSCWVNNFDLCIYDSRGSGSSSTQPITFGFKEHIDLLYVLLFCY